MTFTIHTLGVLKHVPAPDNSPDTTFWFYRTTDTVAMVDASGYFNGVGDTMSPGDRIVISAVDGGADRHVAHVDDSVVITQPLK